MYNRLRAGVSILAALCGFVIGGPSPPGPPLPLETAEGAEKWGVLSPPLLSPPLISPPSPPFLFPPLPSPTPPPPLPLEVGPFKSS